jgi:drug/metabolite transporter (DMT)-like permease
MLIAAIFWAGGLVWYKCDPVPMPITSLTAWQALIGGIPVAIAGHTLETVNWNAVGFWPWFGYWYNVFHRADLLLLGLEQTGADGAGERVLARFLIVPVVGVFSGMLVLGEVPHWQDFLALALVLAAIATVLVCRRDRA